MSLTNLYYFNFIVAGRSTQVGISLPTEWMESQQHLCPVANNITLMNALEFAIVIIFFDLFSMAWFMTIRNSVVLSEETSDFVMNRLLFHFVIIRAHHTTSFYCNFHNYIKSMYSIFCRNDFYIFSWTWTFFVTPASFQQFILRWKSRWPMMINDMYLQLFHTLEW